MIRTIVPERSVVLIIISYYCMLIVAYVAVESLSNATMWDVYPAQAMDMAVLPLLQQHRVPVARVYSALAARADLHAGLMAPDCTHFGIDALMYLNEEVMKTIAVGG